MTCTSGWQKYPDEVLLVGIDWTDALDGAAIASVVSVEVLGSIASAPLTATALAVDGTVLPMRLEGGAASKLGQHVHARVTTNEGETLAISVPVEVLTP